MMFKTIAITFTITALAFLVVMEAMRATRAEQEAARLRRELKEARKDGEIFHRMRPYLKRRKPEKMTKDAAYWEQYSAPIGGTK